MKRKSLLPSKLRILFAILLLIPASLSLSAADLARILRAGAAASNITPPLGESIVGGWEPIPAANIHDELFARCLVLDDGDTRLAIAICDNVGIPVEVFDRAKKLVERATGIPPSHQLMASTHTHSATTARGPLKTSYENELTDYQRFLAHRISDGIRRAIAQLEPAQIGWGAIDEPSEVFNRRWFVSDAGLLSNPFGGVDRVRMNPPVGSPHLERPAGPTDPEISFVSVQSVAGRPIALLANYSLHYVGGVRRGDVSADYFGYFAKFIERKLGATGQSPPFVGMLSNGTSGDVNNIDFRGRSRRKYDRYEKMQEVAEKVASRVADAHQQVVFHDWVPLVAKQRSLALTTRQPTSEMLAYLKEATSAEGDEQDRRHRREKIYAERLKRIVDGPKEVEVPLQTFRIGDLGIAAIPFETFAETGLELKRRSPLRQTFTIELAGGSFGYLPTPAQHRLGGYETWLGTSYVEISASTKIVETLLTMLAELRQKAGP